MDDHFSFKSLKSFVRTSGQSQWPSNIQQMKINKFCKFKKAKKKFKLLVSFLSKKRLSITFFSRNDLPMPYNAEIEVITNFIHDSLLLDLVLMARPSNIIREQKNSKSDTKYQITILHIEVREKA